MTLMGLRRSSYAKLWLCYGGQVAGVTNEGVVQIHLSMSVGHSFARGGNGYAVSGGRKRSEGLRGRKARRYAGRGSPAVDAKSASTLSWRFLPLPLELQLRPCPKRTA